MKYVKMNMDLPGTEFKRGDEWPLAEAPGIIRHLAGQNKEGTMHKIMDKEICTVFEKGKDSQQSTAANEPELTPDDIKFSEEEDVFADI